MTQDAQPIVQTSSRQVPFQEIVTPLSARALFWRPRFLAGSEFLHHLPFLFWLVDMQRPSVAVSFGVGDGVGYFGLCQAMDKLGADARCHGLDPRPESEGGPNRDVRAYNEAQFADFSRLEARAPRDIVHQFADGSVDLMLIDMSLDADLIHSLSHDWTRKLSDRAVILFHDTQGRFASGPEQGLLQSLTQAYPVIAFHTGCGLAAVLHGQKRLDKLERLAEMDLGTPGYTEVHHVFARLGAANRHEWVARSETARAEAAVEQARSADMSLSELRDVLSDREAALDKRRQSDETRADQLATLQSQLFEVQTSHDARADEVANHAKALAQVEADALRAAAARDAALIRERDRADIAVAKLTEVEAARGNAEAEAQAEAQKSKEAAERVAAQLQVKDRALELSTERLEAAEKARAEAQAEVMQLQEAYRVAQEAAATPEPVIADDSVSDAAPASEAAEALHFDEIRILTTRLESAQQEVLTLQKELRAKADQGAHLTTLEGELAATRQHVDDLLRSTSWRLTSPLRKVVSTLRRQG